MSNQNPAEQKAQDLYKKYEKLTGFTKGGLNYWIVEQMVKQFIYKM